MNDNFNSTGHENAMSLRARDIMTRRQPTLTPEMDVYAAADLIVTQRLEGASVVDERGALVGVLTEKDCISALTRPLVDRVPIATVADVMSRDVYSIAEDISFLTIANVFAHKPYRWLPVIRHDGVVVGCVGRREILRAMIGAMRVQPGYGASFLYLSAVESGPVLAI